MKKLRKLITSVIVIAIIVSSFTLKAKKIWRYCATADLTTTSCNAVIVGYKRVTPGDNTRYYVPCWEGDTPCNGVTCTTSARFVLD